MKDPREGEPEEKPWKPLPSDLPPHVKAYITRLVKEHEFGKPAILDVYDMATLIAVKSFEAGRRKVPR